MLTPEYVVMGIGLILVTWYFIASVYNRRLGLTIYRWLQQGLDVLGDKSSLQASWIGSSGSGARIGLTRAHPPFKRLELVYLLESRELAPLWLVDRWRGKRDQFILRGTLTQSPRGELEVLPPNDGLLKPIRQDASAPWTLSSGPQELVVARRGTMTPPMDQLTPFLDKYSANLKRFSWGPKDPHVLIILRLAGLRAHEAAALFKDILLATGDKPTQ